MMNINAQHCARTRQHKTTFLQLTYRITKVHNKLRLYALFLDAYLDMPL
jgi:phosphoribosyl-dephospho-CoA transferase